MTTATRKQLKQLALLQAVAREEVGWRDGGRGRSFRLWTSETDYQLVTQQMAPMFKGGLVRCQMAAGYRHIGKGYVELTDAGRLQIRQLSGHDDCPVEES